MGRLTQAELAYRIRGACMRVARKVRLDASSLPPHLFTVLVHVEHEPRTATAIAQSEHVTPASMSRTVCDLEARGLISRDRHPTDGRTQLISLTEAGRAELQRIRSQRDSWMRAHIASCTPAEREILAQAAAILDRFVRGEER